MGYQPYLVGDVILVVLDHVIGPAPERSSKESEDTHLREPSPSACPQEGSGTVGDLPVAEETALDDLHDKIRSLSLCHVRAEPMSGKR